jgi:predicted peptidase
MRRFLIPAMFAVSTALAAPTEPREWQAPNGTPVKYRWSAPEQPAPGKTYPLVLFLHGAGERGDDNQAHLKHGVVPIIDGARQLGTPVFLIAPQCPQGRWWSPADASKTRLAAATEPNALLEAVLALVSESVKKHPIDPARIHVTGISMGGFATWDLLGRAPRLFASAVPICGGGDPRLADRFKDIPIRAFHGETDPVVPVQATRGMIEALEKAGGKPLVTYYPAVEHDSWTRTYANPEVIRWMLGHHKPSP